jgi:hypothetical protein
LLLVADDRGAEVSMELELAADEEEFVGTIVSMGAVQAASARLRMPRDRDRNFINAAEKY